MQEIQALTLLPTEACANGPRYHGGPVRAAVLASQPPAGDLHPFDSGASLTVAGGSETLQSPEGDLRPFNRPRTSFLGGTSTPVPLPAPHRYTIRKSGGFSTGGPASTSARLAHPSHST